MCISHPSEYILFCPFECTNYPYMPSLTTSESFSTSPCALLSHTRALFSNLNVFLTPRMPFSVHVCPSQPMRLVRPYECLCQSQHAVLDHQCVHVWREHGARAWRLAWGKSTGQGHRTRARNKGTGHEHAWGKWTWQGHMGARAGNRGTGQGYGTRARRDKGTIKGNG